MSIMPTGGVAPTEENLRAWFEAGVTCVGKGSKLMVKDESGNFDLERIEELTRYALGLIENFRKNKG